MQQNADISKNLVVSYLTLRKSVGILGMALPFVLALGDQVFFSADGIRESISCYYHTKMGNVFVGTLFVLGAFLFSYKGPSDKDDRAGDLACLFAICVALFPTPGNCLVNYATSPDNVEKIIGTVHGISAGLFFLTLAYFCLKLFTKTAKDVEPTKKKLARNRVYKACGYIILFCVAVIALMGLVVKLNEKGILDLQTVITTVRKYDPVFWLESAAIFFFGVSWFVKGEAILKDIEE